MDTSTLLKNLTSAEEAVVQARAAIVREIIDRLGEMTPNRFALTTGLNAGNFYSLLRGRWNGVVAERALLAFDGMLSETAP